MTTLKLMTKEKEKTMDMEYPEEIYQDGAACTLMSASQRQGWAGWGRRFAYRTGFDVGKAAGVDPLEGYSNLTEAIKADGPIDWWKLNGLKVQCVKPGVGTLRGTLTLERVSVYYPFTSSAWWGDDADSTYVSAFNHAWRGEDGWTLWLKGEVPMRRKTADELEVGTYFLGEARHFKNAVMYVGNSGPDEEKLIHFTPSMTTSGIPASEWVVLEEYGPYQKPGCRDGQE